MKEIREGLFQFTRLDDDINLSTHCYLLRRSDPLLVHTGGSSHIEEVISGIKSVLGDQQLSYILVSSIRADAFGGINEVLKAYPGARVICGEYASRQLPEFGVKADLRVVKGGDLIIGEDYEYEVIDCPIEAGMRSGVLLYEKTSGIFFSANLMMRSGGSNGEVTDSVWSEEVAATGIRQIPNRIKLRMLRHELNKLDPSFVAVGHGLCLELHY